MTSLPNALFLKGVTRTGPVDSTGQSCERKDDAGTFKILTGDLGREHMV